MIKILLLIILWDLACYWMHRWAHNAKWYLRIHAAHHKKIYNAEQSWLPSIGSFFLWHGCWKQSLDILISFTMPAVVISYIFNCWWVLLFHYLYEVFLADGLWQHNVRIKSNILAGGQYHLEHHRNPRCNYGSILPIWDKIFKTEVKV